MFAVDDDSLIPFVLPSFSSSNTSSQLDWKQFAIKVKSAIEAKDDRTISMNELGRLFPRAIRPSNVTSLKTQIKTALGEDIKILRSAITLSSSSSDACNKDLMALDSCSITDDNGGGLKSWPRNFTRVPRPNAEISNSSVTELPHGPPANDKKSRNVVFTAVKRLMRWMVGLP
jgi:hypothetical protein